MTKTITISKIEAVLVACLIVGLDFFGTLPEPRQVRRYFSDAEDEREDHYRTTPTPSSYADAEYLQPKHCFSRLYSRLRSNDVLLDALVERAEKKLADIQRMTWGSVSIVSPEIHDLLWPEAVSGEYHGNVGALLTKAPWMRDVLNETFYIREVDGDKHTAQLWQVLGLAVDAQLPKGPVQSDCECDVLCRLIATTTFERQPIKMKKVGNRRVKDKKYPKPKKTVVFPKDTTLKLFGRGQVRNAINE